MKLLLLAGYRASGKTTFLDMAREKGIPVYEMSYFFYKEMEKRGIPKTQENIRKFQISEREKHGKGVFAEIVVNEIMKDKPSLAVVSGVRSPEEVDVFKSKGDVLIVEIRADERVRFERVLSRGAQTDPKTFDEFKAREEADIKVGAGKIIDMADIIIENNGDIDTFKKKAINFINFIKER